MVSSSDHLPDSDGLSSGAGMDRVLNRASIPWWRGRAVVGVVVVVALLTLIWLFLPTSNATNIESSELQIGEVARAPFDDQLAVRAVVVPASTILVGVVSGGLVERLEIQDGAVVTEGQPLAVLANPDLELQVLGQEAQIASQLGGIAGQQLGMQTARVSRANQVSEAQFELLRARRELDIRRQLHEKGFVSDAGVRSYEEEVEYQERQYAQLTSGRVAGSQFERSQDSMLNAARARLRSNLAAVRDSLQSLIIRAPTSGRLTNFNLQPGQTVAAGDSAGQIDSEGAWKLEAEVDEYYLGRLAIGQKASAEGIGELAVSRIFPTVENGRFRVELAFEGEPSARLNRGQAVDVRIVLGETRDAVVAPMGGWVLDGGASAFVIDEDGGEARRSPVQIGRRNPRQVEIVSGLTPGQKIILSNLSDVDADIVNIR